MNEPSTEPQNPKTIVKPAQVPPPHLDRYPEPEPGPFDVLGEIPIDMEEKAAADEEDRKRYKAEIDDESPRLKKPKTPGQLATEARRREENRCTTRHIRRGYSGIREPRDRSAN